MAGHKSTITADEILQHQGLQLSTIARLIGRPISTLSGAIGRLGIRDKMGFGAMSHGASTNPNLLKQEDQLTVTKTFDCMHKCGRTVKKEVMLGHGRGMRFSCSHCASRITDIG